MSSIDDDMELIRNLIEWDGTNAATIASTIGVANTTINRFANGTAKSRLSRATLLKLKAHFPLFPPFQKEPELPSVDMNRDFLPVEIMPSYGGMGGGGEGGRNDEIEYGMVPRRLIQDELRGQPSDFLLIDVRGDSMQDDFRHGDQILIDKRDRNPLQPGPFALWDGDGYVIKLVERVPQRKGWYRIFSANPRYSADEIEETETTILGRPVWFGRRL